MAKPIKALELHYPMIQFLIIIYILPPPQAFPRLSGDRGTREHARSAREG